MNWWSSFSSQVFRFHLLISFHFLQVASDIHLCIVRAFYKCCKWKRQDCRYGMSDDVASIFCVIQHQNIHSNTNTQSDAIMRWRFFNGLLLCFIEIEIALVNINIHIYLWYDAITFSLRRYEYIPNPVVLKQTFVQFKQCNKRCNNVWISIYFASCYPIRYEFFIWTILQWWIFSNRRPHNSMHSTSNE